MSNLTIAVLLSAGRHPVSGAPRACRGDAVALALGQRLGGDQVLALHAGSADEPALRDYLALGAGNVEVLAVPAGSDVAVPLAKRLADVDLIIAGSRTEQGASSGILPYALARALRRPIVSNVLEARIEGSEVKVRQFLPKGQRRGIAAPLPAILVVHPLAPADIRYAYARRMSGRIGETEPDATSLHAGISPVWSVETASRRPQILKAEDKKSAHARLLAATVSEAKGGVVAIDGSSVDKAQVMLSFLRDHRLVDF